MDICLLGTGGMLPLKNRFLTSCYIEHEGRAVLIDCGEGTQVAAAKAQIKISRIEAILITHTHADHITGLPGLLLSIANTERTEPLEIYVPSNAVGMIDALLKIAGRLPYETRVKTLSLREPMTLTLGCIDRMMTLRALPLKHSTPCLGYSLTLNHKRVFLPEKADELGVPLRERSTLHNGGSITVDGRTVTPDMVTSDPRPPEKLTYVTDTLPIAEIADFAKGSDLFICEGMYGDREKKKSMNEKGHMLMQDACELAKRGEVKALWLTHYSPAENDPAAYKNELTKLFKNVTVTKDGAKTKI
ncbi:MAG: ribonuclease Z [Ruminococcus sp.]|nr:ribonuclease Z [Ruminococcus sp.]